MTRSVLVIGAASPIGSAVSAELMSQGWDVTGTSTRPNGGGARILDIDDERSVRAALDAVRPRAVISLATPRSTGDGDTDATARAAASLHRLRDLSALRGAQSLVFASSSAVYGTAHRAPRREQDQLDVTSAYARLKAASEAVLASPHGTNIGTVSLRIFNVFGPGLHSSLINRMFAGSDDVPDVLDTDDFVRDYIHVSDVARAFAAVVDTNASGYNLVNVGTGIGTGNRSLLSARGAKGVARPVAPGFLSSSVAEISRLRALPGGAPRVDLGELLKSDDRRRSDLIWG